MADSRKSVDLNYRMNQPDIYHDFGGRVVPNAAVAALAGIGNAMIDNEAAKEEAAKKASELGSDVSGFFQQFTAAVEMDKADAASVSAARSGDVFDKFLSADFSTDDGLNQFREAIQPIIDNMEMSQLEKSTRQKMVLANWVSMMPEKEKALYMAAKAMGMSGFKPEFDEKAKKVMQTVAEIHESAAKTGVSVPEYLRTKREQMRIELDIKKIDQMAAHGKLETAALYDWAAKKPNLDMYSLRNGDTKVNGVATPNLSRVLDVKTPLTGPDAATVYQQAQAELHSLKLKARTELTEKFVKAQKDKSAILDAKSQEDLMAELEDGYRTFETIVQSKDPLAIVNHLNSYREGQEKDYAYRVYGPLQRLFPGRTEAELNGMLWDHVRVIQDLEDGFSEKDQQIMRDWQSSGTPWQKRYADQMLGYARLTPEQRKKLYYDDWYVKALTDPNFIGNGMAMEDRYGSSSATRTYVREVSNPNTRDSFGVNNMLHLVAEIPGHPLALGFADNHAAATSFFNTQTPTHDISREKMRIRFAENIALAQQYMGATTRDETADLVFDPMTNSVKPSAFSNPLQTLWMKPFLDDLNTQLKLWRTGNPQEYAKIVESLKRGGNYFAETEAGATSPVFSEFEAGLDKK